MNEKDDSEKFIQLDLFDKPVEETKITSKKKKGAAIPSFTREELQEELEEIKKKGWINGEEMGDGSHGHTLELLLGVPENNLAIPDLGEFELKSTLSDSNTPVTLFSKVPERKDDLSLSEFIMKYGYWVDEEKRYSLNCTLSALDKNNLGWILKVDRDNDKIDFIQNDVVTSSQEISVLKKIVSKKITNVVLVVVDRKSKRKRIYKYVEAYLYSDAEVIPFVDCLEKGLITFDWRMHKYPNKSARDHGSAYRMKEKHLPSLYAKKERII